MLEPGVSEPKPEQNADLNFGLRDVQFFLITFPLSVT